MRRLVITISLVSLLFAACKHETVFKEVQSNKGLFTMQLPEYMRATNSMFPGVSVLQYTNDSVPLYILAFDTSRDGLNESSLKAFYDSSVSQPQMDSAVIEPAKFVTVDGDSAYITTLSGSINGLRLVYRIETIASRTRFFYIQVWTKAYKQKDLNEVMDKMLYSFRDLNHMKV